MFSAVSMMITKNSSYDEQNMRAYLLGKLVAENEFEFENVWFEDDETVERLESVRAYLISDFLGGDLSAEDENCFRQNFLTLPRNKLFVDLAESNRRLIDTRTVKAFDTSKELKQLSADEIGLRKKITGFFSFGGFGLNFLAPSALLLLLAFGVFFAVKFVFRNGWDELARTTETVTTPSLYPVQTEITPIPDTDPAPANVSDKNKTNLKTRPEKDAVNSAPNLPNKTKPAPAPSPKTATPESAKNFVVTLALVTGVRGTSSDSSVPTIKILPETKTLRLTYETPQLFESYKEFNARIISQRSDQTAFTQKLSDLNLSATGRRLSLDIPAKVLTGGSYYLEITAAGNDKSESLGRYSFTVQR